MPFPLSLTDIVARTGKRTAVFTVPARELLDPGLARPDSELHLSRLFH